MNKIRLVLFIIWLIDMSLMIWLMIYFYPIISTHHNIILALVYFFIGSYIEYKYSKKLLFLLKRLV